MALFYMVEAPLNLICKSSVARSLLFEGRDMKQKIYFIAKTILLLIMGLLVYPAFLAARESKIDTTQKIYNNRYIPLVDAQY